MINKTLAILAGGKSSRMNYKNKALLIYKEKTFIENIINYFDDFKSIQAASIEDLDEVEGIGEIRATYIKNGLIKMKQLVLLDRHI